MKDLSIVIPAFNEANRIQETLVNFHTYLSNQPLNYELIIADDGSTDNTIEIVQSIALTIPHIKIIKLEKNRGKGQAVRAGMLAATGKIRLFSDADGSTPIEEIGRVITPIQNNEALISIGSRYLEGSQVIKPQPYYRRVWSRLANKVVQRVLLPGIVDPNCGFKAFDGKTAQLIFQQCTVNEWSFDLEVLGIAKKLGFKIAEVPVKWINDEQTKGKLSHLPQEIKNLIQIKKRIKEDRIIA